MASRETKVKLTAQVQQYIDGMEQAARATRETGTEAEKLAQKREAIETMGRSAMVAGGLIMGGLALATRAAISWDSAWAGVTKTVEGSPEQLAQVEAGLRGLTAVLPASHEEIAAVAEAAGQLGIKTPNVVAFTKTMIDLGETTNLTASDAATQLARFMTVMGTSQSRVSGIGSALVELGNNYATTEAEIMSMAMRLSGAGAQIGMSEGQVLGLSTALSSVGIEAEAGGSAMSKVMIDIASSVDKGGERLDQFAKIAGVSAQTFSAQWKKDPGEALAMFVKGLANTEAQGKSTFGVLEELGITEVRMRDALLRSASAADQFSEAMATGNAAMEENSALTEEAAKRYDTTASKIEIMKNRVNDAFIGIGEKLLPAVDAGAESVARLADSFSGLGGPMETVVAWGGALLGTGLLGVGVWMTAIPQIAKYREAMVSLELAGGKLEKTLGYVGKAAGLAAAAGVLIAITREAEVEVGALTNALERNADATAQVGAAAEAVSNRGWGNLYGEFGKLKVSADEVSASLDHMQKNWFEQKFLSGTGTDLMHLRDTGDALRVLGDEIGKVAAVDLSSAQDSLSKLAKQYNLSDEQMTAFINNSPALRKALEGQAASMGLTTDGADLLKVALGGVKPPADAATNAAEDNAGALDDLEGAASSTQEAVAGLADEIRGFGSAALDTREANRRLENSYSELASAIAESGGSFDITSEAGRRAEEALDGVAEATNIAAAATLEQTGSQETMNAKLSEGREKLIAILEPYLGSRDAAAAYVDQLNLISPEKVTEIIAETDEATGKINEVSANNPPDKLFQINADAAGAYEGINGVNVTVVDEKTAYVWGDNADGLAKIQEINSRQTPRKIVEIEGGTSGFERAWNSVIGRVGSAWVNIFGVKSNSSGGMYAYANGGIAEFASGGFPTGIYSGGPPIHKFAEPETGWEAYISGKPSERDRNRQIWAETGQRLGVGVGGGPSHVEVSLAGAVLQAELEGQPVTLIVKRQIADVFSTASAGSLTSKYGARRS